ARKLRPSRHNPGSTCVPTGNFPITAACCPSSGDTLSTIQGISLREVRHPISKTSGLPQVHHGGNWRMFGAELRPRAHKPPALFQYVTSLIGGFRLVLENMS